MICCPTCGNEKSKTIDSRPVGKTVRRRRRCPRCETRWTTFEIAMPMDDEKLVTNATKIFSEIMRLNRSARFTAYEVIRGLIARQDLDGIKGKDAA